MRNPLTLLRDTPMRRGLCTGLFLLLAISASAQQQQALPVTVVQPEVRTLQEWDEFTGRFEPYQRVEVRAQVSGYLQAIHFTDGQLVAVDDLLFTLDPRPFEAVIAAAQAELNRTRTEFALAQQEFRRAERLIAQKALSQEELDVREARIKTTQSHIESARAELRRAQLDLEYSRIKAPISGRISRRNVDIGNLIQTANSPVLTTIVTQQPVYFVFDISESDYLKYRRLHPQSTAGSLVDSDIEVQVKLLDEQDFTHNGQVDFIDTGLDQDTGSIRFRALFADNAGGLLLPGVFGRVRIAATPAAETMLLPDRAIVSDMNNKLVMTVDAENTVVAKAVTLGPMHEGMRIIRSGLEADDRIIIEGLLRARPGAKVVPHAPQSEPEQ